MKLKRLHCAYCKELKFPNHFYKSFLYETGYDYLCKECRKLYLKTYRKQKKTRKYEKFFELYETDSILSPRNSTFGALFLFYRLYPQEWNNALFFLNKKYDRNFESVENHIYDRTNKLIRSRVFDWKKCAFCQLIKPTYSLTKPKNTDPRISQDQLLTDWNNEWKWDTVLKKRKIFNYGFTERNTKDGWAKYCCSCELIPENRIRKQSNAGIAKVFEILDGK